MEGLRRGNRERPSKGPSQGAFGRNINSSVDGDSRQADIDRDQRAARQKQYIAAALAFHNGKDKTAYGKKAAIAGVWGLELLAGGYLKGGRFSGDDDAIYKSVRKNVDHHIGQLGGGITSPSPPSGLDTAALLAVVGTLMHESDPGVFTPTFTSGAAIRLLALASQII